MRTLVKIRSRMRKIIDRSRLLFSAKYPVHVFHHLPKCGGTSLNEILSGWFVTIRDYRPGWNMDYPPKVDLQRLRSRHCLCGHFELDGYHLHQRYPEVFQSDAYRVFTFLRDPLEVRLSLFRFETINNVSAVRTLEEHLFARRNYLAKRFPATLDNFREVIDGYFFVGILEEKEQSMAVLAALLDKPPVLFPWLNKSRPVSSHRGVREELAREVIERFREENALDYLIYDYCVEKFRKAAALSQPDAPTPPRFGGRPFDHGGDRLG